MATLPYLPGLAKADLTWALDGKSWSTAAHFVKSVASAWPLADETALIAAIASAISDGIIGLFGPANVHQATVVTDLSTAMGLVTEGSGVGPGTASVSNPLPINVVLRATFPSALRYRGGRPGMNWSGLDRTNQMAASSTMWSSTTEAQWISGMEAFISDLTGIALPSGETADICWVSYYTGHAVRPTPLTFKLASLCQIQQRICTRRKRLGRGVAGE